MKSNTLAFGTKINCTFAALAAMLGLAIWFGLHTTGSLADSLEKTAGITARKIELAGILNTAESDMAVGQRGTIVYSYAKDSGQSAGSKQLFRDSSESFRKALAEICHILVTDEEKQLVSHMEAGFA